MLAALVLLPLAGCPVSILLILTGATFEPRWGLALAAAGIGGNISLAYLLAQRWMRRALLYLLNRRGYTLPVVLPEDHLKLVLALRITPGIPLFVQNYLLGLSGVRFAPYFLISAPILMAYSSAFVLFGGSIFALKGGGIIAAACLLIALVLLTKLARRYVNASMFMAPGPSAPGSAASPPPQG